MANGNLLTQPMAPEAIQPIRSILENIQQQGLKEFDKKIEKVKEDVLFEQNLCMFEFLYSIAVPKQERVKTAKAVRKLRDEYWKVAIKEAEGNKNEAIVIYDKMLKKH